MGDLGLKLARGIGHIHGVLPKHLEGHHVESSLVGAGEYHRSSASLAVSPKPVHGGYAPAIARAEARKPKLGHRRQKVVANRALVLQKLSGHDGADRVQTDILGPGRAAAVAVETGKRVGATRFEWLAQHIAIRHRSIIRYGAVKKVAYRVVMALNNSAISSPDPGDCVVRAATFQHHSTKGLEARSMAEEKAAAIGSMFAPWPGRA